MKRYLENCRGLEGSPTEGFGGTVRSHGGVIRPSGPGTAGPPWGAGRVGSSSQEKEPQSQTRPTPNKQELAIGNGTGRGHGEGAGCVCHPKSVLLSHAPEREQSFPQLPCQGPGAHSGLSCWAPMPTPEPKPVPQGEYSVLMTFVFSYCPASSPSSWHHGGPLIG